MRRIIKAAVTIANITIPLNSCSSVENGLYGSVGGAKKNKITNKTKRKLFAVALYRLDVTKYFFNFQRNVCF